MGFFSRNRKPPAHIPPPPQATMVAHPQQLNVNPPPYFQNLRTNTDTAPAPYAPQPVLQDRHTWDNGFISVDDFNAIQQARDQDVIADQFNAIIADIDEDRWQATDNDLAITLIDIEADEPQETNRAIQRSQPRRKPSQARTQKITIWSKASFYTNSRLPPHLAPLRVYIPTWPLICLAAQNSANAYRKPTTSQQKQTFVSADVRSGTKAMVISSAPCDEKKTIVFAIRGTSALSLRDWGVNLRTDPVSLNGFVDDPDNYCHEGFLQVAKAMIKPIAARLQTLIEEYPGRVNHSLLITGHSAGGAVAALLFAHMLSSIDSELQFFTGVFRRVHCVTFGAPPVTLIPLKKPDLKRFQKCLFFSFINEGDPVVRAERAYIRSLIDLLSSPLPSITEPRRRKEPKSKNSLARLQQSVSKLDLTLSKFDLTTSNNTQPSNALRPHHSRWNLSQPNLSFAPTKTYGHTPYQQIWPVPAATLSNAGRLVLMRVPPQPIPTTQRGSNTQMIPSNKWERDHLKKVTAHTITDEQLRGVIFGDPAMHAMEVYLRRVDMLALKAVTAREG